MLRVRFPDFEGMNQRRAELKLRPIIPAASMHSVEARTRYMQAFSRSINDDVKHSRNWRCEFCSTSPTPWPTSHVADPYCFSRDIRAGDAMVHGLLASPQSSLRRELGLCLLFS